MTRTQFIQSQGATCKNFAWSWSFINRADKTIIFGAWDRETIGTRTRILMPKWSVSERGRRQPGYGQALEHIRLIENDGYRLMTFPLKYSDAKRRNGKLGPAEVEDFEPILTEKFLIKLGDSWYATDAEDPDFKSKKSSTLISPTRFRKAFQRFQSIHQENSGWVLDSFSNRDSFAYKWEGYKQSIPDRAGAVLNASRWSRKEIGKGDIVKRVIAAIELPHNNLLQWQGRQGPDSRAHSRLYELQSDPKGLEQLETYLFDLYSRNRADEEVFEGVVRLCGRRYELLGYLFFIADPGRFLPIRTRSFDKAIVELGVNLTTAGLCGWENYLSFISVIREVRTRLRAEGILDASLLDAHSFCWILARHENLEKDIEVATRAMMEPFNGTLRAGNIDRAFSPNDDAGIRNMQLVAAKCVASGQIAEEIALNAERNRLIDEGRPDLAAKVESVADRPGLGYDIKSFEVDDTLRYIEVKNVSNGNRFFLSEGEWLNSRQRDNYWFYLVGGVTTTSAKVTLLSADQVKASHLRPVNFLVSYG